MKQNRGLVRVTEDFIRSDLSAGAVKVLFLLASVAQAGRTNCAVISNARIAKRTGLTNITRFIKELCAAGAIVERVERFKNNRQRCNAFILPDVVCAPKKYTLVPVLAVTLPKSCLRLFILYCIHANENGRCLLSLSMIQKLSGMARSTIISCCKELVAQGYITKQQYQRQEGDFGYNRVYLSHMLRRRYGLRSAETFRVIVGAKMLAYASKCAAEHSLFRPARYFLRVMRCLFRSMRVAAFIRRARRMLKYSAAFFYPKPRGLKMITRNIYSTCVNYLI